MTPHRLLAALALVLIASLPARAFETAAQAAYVYDVNTGTVLMNKNADTPLPPASMSKLMPPELEFCTWKDWHIMQKWGVSDSTLFNYSTV